MEKTHYKKLRDPNYIGAYELMNADGTTNEIVVLIEGVKKEELKNAEKNQGLVIYLKGQKPMIVNSVNAKSITSATGSPFVEDWINKPIVLYVVKIKAFGETMEALRVRKEPPAATPLPTLTEENKGFIQGIQALKDKKTDLKGLLTILQEKFTITESILKQFEDASK